jgi:hypothetical protein
MIAITNVIKARAKENWVLSDRLFELCFGIFEWICASADPPELEDIEDEVRRRGPYYLEEDGTRIAVCALSMIAATLPRDVH